VGKTPVTVFLLFSLKDFLRSKLAPCLFFLPGFSSPVVFSFFLRWLPPLYPGHAFFSFFPKSGSGKGQKVLYSSMTISFTVLKRNKPSSLFWFSHFLLVRKEKQTGDNKNTDITKVLDFFSRSLQSFH
jgi:hypothetical protein